MSEQADFIPEDSSPAPQRHRGAGGEDLQPFICTHRLGPDPLILLNTK